MTGFVLYLATVTIAEVHVTKELIHI